MAAIEELEIKLDSFDSRQRREALEELFEKAQKGQIELPQPGTDVNLHCHTFFSYNSYGYSPSKFAWLAKKQGLAVAGIVDFDVLDGVQEFLDAAKLLNLKAVAGIETRVFLPQFSERVINSPGEPSISYHMGFGFPSGNLNPSLKEFQKRLQNTAQLRNIELIKRVNKFLSPVELDYDNDVLPVTPAGNATERHICIAYARKAKTIFNDDAKLAQFWTEKLGTDAKSLGLPEGRNLLNTIRNKTMKKGGAGYVLPDKGAFPTMSEMDKFSLAAGAIPTMTWLDGTSEGEKSLEELINVAIDTGVAAFNVIPDRNYMPGKQDEKFNNLKFALALADSKGLPIVCGTEMNSPGQKFVDDFKTKELAEFVPLFLKGAHIVYAHSVMQRQCGLAYASEWSKKSFTNIKDKNDFFQTLGQKLEPSKENILTAFDNTSKSNQILAKFKS